MSYQMRGLLGGIAVSFKGEEPGLLGKIKRKKNEPKTA
jgi:hypothetical protein